MVRIVDNVQGFEPKLIHLDDSEVECTVGVIASMSSGQHSRHALHVAQSPYDSKMFSQKPLLI